MQNNFSIVTRKVTKNANGEVVVLNGGVEQNLTSYLTSLKNPGSGWEHHFKPSSSAGMGAKPKVGLVGFNVSNLRLPDFIRPWEDDENKPERIASPLEIMIDAPLGGAAFNNEFGRPSILGYFRSFETSFKDSTAYGYHKPIMLAVESERL